MEQERKPEDREEHTVFDIPSQEFNLAEQKVVCGCY